MGFLVLALAALLAAIVACMVARNTTWRSSLAGGLTCIGFFGANYFNLGYFDPMSAISLPIVFGVGFIVGLIFAKLWPKKSS
jgi:hypothetical protein